MRFKIFALIMLVVFILACSKEENPFAPPSEIKEDMDYEFSVFPWRSGFQFENSKPYFSAEIICFSEDTDLLGYSVETRWDDNSNWDVPVKKSGDDKYYNSFDNTDFTIRTVNEAFADPSRIADYGPLGITPIFNSLIYTGKHEHYPFSYPKYRFNIIGSDYFYVERQYKVKGLDIYGNKTKAVIKKYKFARVGLVFVGSNDYGNREGFIAHAEDKSVGTVISITAASVYTVEVDFYRAVGIMYGIQQNYGPDFNWYLFGIVIRDYQEQIPVTQSSQPLYSGGPNEECTAIGAPWNQQGFRIQKVGEEFYHEGM